jgi:hypothetical protein
MKKERILLAISLLLVTAHYFINPFFLMPDYLRGLLIGVGLGLEIIALVMMKRKGSVCNKKRELIV